MREVWFVERAATFAALVAIICGMVELEELFEFRWGLWAVKEADDEDEVELFVGIKSKLKSSVEFECCIGQRMRGLGYK